MKHTERNNREENLQWQEFTLNISGISYMGSAEIPSE